MTTPEKHPTNYVLVDFENVQPKNLALLQDAHFRIYMFVGAQQTKLDMGIVSMMQTLGMARAKYVRVEETGSNALEAQMCKMGANTGKTRGKSPDRVDALVWAIDALLGKVRAPARVRAV